MKRTTLVLNDQRLSELKKLAAKEERTLSDLVDEILLAGITQRKAPKRRISNFSLPSFAMGGTRVNIADRDQLEDLMRDE